MERPVGSAVAAPVQPVPDRPSARSFVRARPAEHGEGGLGAHASGVVAGRVAELDFLDRREDLGLMGDVGTGKTHMASALCAVACERRLDREAGSVEKDAPIVVN